MVQPANDEILVERFNQWADERISDCQICPAFSPLYAEVLKTRITTLQSAKANLERLAKGLDSNLIRRIK